MNLCLPKHTHTHTETHTQPNTPVRNTEKEMLYINYLHFFICTFALRSLQKSSLETFFIVSTEELRTKNEKNHNISTRCQPKRAEIKNRKHKIYKRIRNSHTHRNTFPIAYWLQLNYGGITGVMNSKKNKAKRSHFV